MSAHVPRIPGYIVKIPDDSRTNRDANRCVDYYVFEWESKRLYIWPERFHRRQPNQEEIAEAKARSINQLRKLMEKYAKTELVVGAHVDFDLFDDRLSIANNVEKCGNEPRDKIQYRNCEMMVSSIFTLPGIFYWLDLNAKLKIPILAQDRLCGKARRTKIVPLVGLH